MTTSRTATRGSCALCELLLALCDVSCVWSERERVQLQWVPHHTKLLAGGYVSMDIHSRAFTVVSATAWANHGDIHTVRLLALAGLDSASDGLEGGYYGKQAYLRKKLSALSGLSVLDSRFCLILFACILRHFAFLGGMLAVLS